MERKALSIRQPWAWAIVALGKDVENRTWRVKAHGTRPILIHAGAGLKGSDVADFLRHVEARPVLAERLAAAGGLDPVALRAMAGGIVGRATLTGCVAASASPWFVGPFGFTLAEVEALPFQPCKGQLGFFDPFPAEHQAHGAAKPRPPEQNDLFPGFQQV